MAHQPSRQWHSTPPPVVTSPYPAVTTPSDPGPARSARGLCRWLCAGLSVLLAFTLLEFVFNISLYEDLGTVAESNIVAVHPAYDSLRTTTEVMTGLGTLLSLPVVVLWLVWLWRIRANAEAFAPGRIRHHRWWAIFSWFLPVVCFFMPKQIINDICDHSDPTSTPVGWYGVPRSGNRGLLNGWWTLWLITLIGGVLLASGRWYNDLTVGDATGTVAVAIVLDFLALPMTILAILVVLRLTALQEHRITSGR